MEKLDLKKRYKDLYNPSPKQVVAVKVPRFHFIMVDGKIPAGIPVDQAPDYQNALETLYGLSFTIKFLCKRRKKNPVDYIVMPLEGLWWFKGSHKQFTVSRQDEWYFTAMIMQPAPVTQAAFEEGRESLRAKKNPAMLDAARFEAFEEGWSMQVMHLGPYANEAPTIERMVTFGAENGYKVHGKHHEIYLGDPRRTAPSKLKTVLRHPIRKK